MEFHLKRRLLQDMAELQKQPYPRISLHPREGDLTRACLVLQPEGWMPIHTTVEFTNRYPLKAPAVRMDTDMRHPNVFGSYICASILNTTEGYTPAYTLKGIAIQLLSFFNSDSIEQTYGSVYSLSHYRKQSHEIKQTFKCDHCGFDGTKSKAEKRRARRHAAKAETSANGAASEDEEMREPHRERQTLAALPDELLLATLEELDFEDLVSFARAWPRISDIVATYDVIRLRELQCFCTKTNFRHTRLGVGVRVPHGKSLAKRSIESEFDLISWDAYKSLGVRMSVHNLSFEHWLPLPLSYRHWVSVKDKAIPVLSTLGSEARLPSTDPVEVLASFMNDIVVRLNQVEATSSRHIPMHSQRSTLRHASEKAIESYFHLFHLLLCLAAENSQFVSDANTKIKGFMDGKTSKAHCPNLGHLLVYLLISDIKITEKMRKAIITEAITRNVVWMLDKRGANMPELSYLEPDPVSHYRLKKSFEASRTSYRLLMFSELFRRIARPSDEKTLVEVRDELFDRHGAPPAGAALRLSTDVRRIHDIDNFNDFLDEMGIEKKPTPERFTSLLRDCVRDSMTEGYSVWGIPATTALAVRYQLEPGVGLYGNGYVRDPPSDAFMRTISFFPNKGNRPQKRQRR
ncbi:ubiquitin-conjugating enzyme family protein [Colletotrichum plurivorum]|uniref:Ubiquitin-conjugating enzyme family protein n=1 Tax=Colletotrichum plurivorum TaxID=2175906 RepID=A0A8H6NBX3_9PEZI|nr:ubiquitin-conjugating enzyme family protein [Colletotrichum plurivorum]